MVSMLWTSSFVARKNSSSFQRFRKIIFFFKIVLYTYKLGQKLQCYYNVLILKGIQSTYTYFFFLLYLVNQNFGLLRVIRRISQCKTGSLNSFKQSTILLLHQTSSTCFSTKRCIQQRLEYRTLEYRTHWNTGRYEVLFSKCPKTRWLLQCSVFQWSRPLI